MYLPVPRDFRSLRSRLACRSHDSLRLLLCAPASASAYLAQPLSTTRTEPASPSCASPDNLPIGVLQHINAAPGICLPDY
ncbi:hypothetical protein HYPSUDRAFT_70628 [Hypholoma sublateritium FD-334 SS-4]|uniref:Uncharacterized protein n=1 Tax=Hypholoma sublateritium (strain FD-334 SS-4) TaxID=945553 RepID=A0A0D2M2W1_HYPSF|nr:hypothetical protein HYPSUDRAFT_70628 [Hypholoma sublateritium FD-334 SS-4]